MQRRSEETKDKLLLIIMHLNAPYSESQIFVKKFYFDEEKKNFKTSFVYSLSAQKSNRK